MSDDLNELSRTASALGECFEPHRGYRMEIDARSVAAIADQLALMSQLARAMEIELAAHRLGEANRTGHNMMEELSTDVLRSVVTETGGNIVRPNFRRTS